MEAPRLVLTGDCRQVPSLRRGWRTPDPSPSPEAALLPRCGPASYGVEMESRAQGDARRRGRFLTKETSGTATTSSGRTPSRTPSPERWREEKAMSESKMSEKSGFAQSPVTSNATTDDQVSMAMCSWGQLPIFGDAAFSDYSVLPPPSPPATPSPLSMATSNQGQDYVDMQESQLHMMYYYCASPMATMQDVDPTLSYGSVGHPYTCADFCKYARKGRGCKDGANCDHCHLCRGKKTKISTRGSHDRRNRRLPHRG
mmetsp:Transcript_36600/g.105456  ORF Transcript_36600/g.105456 Transcript_36600/m.105456 type:complete len:257 (+) Transcript_36600:39-809(+)